MEFSSFKTLSFAESAELHLQSLLAKARARANAAPPPAAPEFDAQGRQVLEWESCPEHGRYAALLQEVVGAGAFRRAVRVPGCGQCLRMRALNELMAGSQIPPRFLSATFESYQAKTSEQKKNLAFLEDYARNFKTGALRTGQNVILTGGFGTGKTHLCVAVMREVLQQGFSALRIKAHDFFQEYWAKDFSQKRKWIAELAKIDLLLLDEVGKHSVSEGAQEAFFALIDARFERVRPTLFVTNLPKDDFEEALGGPAFDRVRQNGGIGLLFNWQSFRGGV